MKTNAASIEAAMSMVAGTARSMGITVEDNTTQVGGHVAVCTTGGI